MRDFSQFLLFYSFTFIRC